ncbi:disease resistance protein RPV1-like isoform X2 [Syzygium oleosum]|uniref:disease resistance protein RPV1-like isoform X2 n=1 Tax=Syzygium oleosum TaxID=219896 RepID=UPI0024BABC24|nr:disease resistance protein RPV1-like isoform X2 [Syzygium oleosum]
MDGRDSSDGTTLSNTDNGVIESLLGAEFEVFLNFRGPDTRLSFADCLYHSMDGAGIRVFRDEEEIRKGDAIGDELERVIKSSTICIPIFSRNYASSAWCLRELAYMVECSRNSNGKAMILPIFFDVDPDDVKLKTGLYYDDLQKHEHKFGCDLVDQWKEALREVAHIKGWHLKDRGQGEIIRLLVTEVLIKLNKRDKNLPDHLVGIQDSVKDVLRLLDEGSPDVHYLVIHGMGGIGKTTLAKVVFNQISSRFHGCSFLSDVREASKGGKVVQLQKQLLSEILNFKPVEISDSDAGINQIKRRFRDKKVLIVLDDLDKWDQLSKFAEKRDWFGLGSRIIITTRDTNFLPIEEQNRENYVQTHIQEFKIYQMREMHHDSAFQLFSKHAFRRDSPLHGYYDISREIIRKAGGLPLALEVIGSSLYCKSKGLWKDTLKKLDLAPNQDVLDKLKISFEMLEDAQREIFLDIACYFIGEERTHPHYMWKALDFFPRSDIIILTRMSLIKIVDDRLLMHHLLRDLGREIIRQEDPKVPEKRSRLWCPKIALHVVETRKANRDLKVIHLTRCHLSTTPDFSTCLNLKILVVNEHCPKSLQIGSSIRKLERLKHLEIIASQFQLSKLSASLHFDLFAVPSAICGLKYLSSLKLEGQCMRELHPSIGEMAGLTSLSLRGCYRLRKLPDSIGKLRSLLVLNLFDTRITELPDSIGDLKRLEKMNLGFTQIRELPNSIGGLQSLLELHLQGTKITELPASIGYLKRLECLVLAESEIRELPKAIGMLENLKVLKSGGCSNLEGEIPSEIGLVSFLEELDLSGSKVSRVPTTINQLSYLRELRLGDNRKLERLPELPASLKHLYFVAESVLGTLGQTSSKWMGESAKGEEWNLSTDITWPPQLWSLRISCDDPRFLTRLPFSLCRLELGDVKSPLEQPFFSNLRYLRYLSELTLFRCWLREIEFEQLESLQNLTVAECELLVRLSGLSSLGKLKELTVWNCSQLLEIQDLGELKSLKELLIKSCSSIERLPDLSKLVKLETLRLFHCESLQGLPDIPKTCHPYVHRCPMLSESVDNYKACEECRKSNMDVDSV